MGKYIKGERRNQILLIPSTIEEEIDEENEVRVIDAFVESLDLEEIGVERAVPKQVGKPGYDPRDMLKLYLYGYRNRVRSSRKLMKLTKTNIEVMWLIKKLTPDFRSISDFRKENAKVLKQVFIEFNLICKELGIFNIKEVSQDGTKIKAVNSKERNYTLNKVDDKIKRLEEHIEEYMRELEENDKKIKAEKLVKIEEMKTRKEIYESYKKEMEKNKETQKSLTDKEAKLMKNNGSFNVCYNNQVLMDTKNHMVVNYEITDKPADFGSMESIVKEAEKEYKEKIESNTTDQGYRDRKDMIKLLENGTMPEVTLRRGEESIILETEYEAAEIDEETKNSNDKEDIKKTLRAGKIPKKYEGKIKKIEVKDVKEKIKETSEKEEDGERKIKEERLEERAKEERIFIRDIETNKVYCPGGEVLRQKAKYEDGSKKYCNKMACKRCKNPCTKSKYREVKFKEGQEEVIPNGSDKKRKREKTKTTTKKKVIIELVMDEKKLKKRMSISEHVHGSMKRWDDASYCLLKGKEKVTGEVALYYCAYNIRRAINKLGVSRIIEYLESKKQKVLPI